MTPIDPRERWARAAAGWEARADFFRDATMPVSAWMVEAIEPYPGQTVLDLAAGIGDTGFLAAELIEPGGELITSDFSPDMLAAAQRRAARLGIGNARFRQMDANVPLDQPAASLDAVLCRWGYMLLNDGEAALRETRRVLKPGGHVALAAWTGREQNRWSSAPTDILVRHGVIEAEPPGPGQFSWARREDVVENLQAAGFVEFRVETVPFQFQFGDLDGWWDHLVQTSWRIADADASMDSSTRQAIRDDLVAAAREFPGYAIPAATWVAVASA